MDSYSASNLSHLCYILFENYFNRDVVKFINECMVCHPPNVDCDRHAYGKRVNNRFRPFLIRAPIPVGTVLVAHAQTCVEHPVGQRRLLFIRLKVTLRNVHARSRECVESNIATIPSGPLRFFFLRQPIRSSFFLRI